MNRPVRHTGTMSTSHDDHARDKSGKFAASTTGETRSDVVTLDEGDVTLEEEDFHRPVGQWDPNEDTSDAPF